MFKPIFSHLRGLRPILLCAVLPVAVACAETPGRPGAQRQVIIGFTAPTDGKARPTLDAIEKAAGIRVRYVSALSERSCAYLLNCPASDATCEAVIQTLRHTPGIDYIQADQTRNLP